MFEFIILTSIKIIARMSDPVKVSGFKPVPIRSYAVTIRPRDGVTDEHVVRFIKWVKKHCSYYLVVTEKLGSARHIHAALFLLVGKLHSNFATDMIRLFKDFDVDEKSTLRKGIKAMYNSDWVTSYLQKGDDTSVIERNLPEVATMETYFDEVPDKRKKGPGAVDPFYAKLEKLWWLYKRPVEETNPANIRNFLMNMMNSERLIKVISDNKKIYQISCALSRYINKEVSWKVEADAFHQDV